MKLLAALILGAVTLLVLVGRRREVVAPVRDEYVVALASWRDLERCDSV